MTLLAWLALTLTVGIGSLAVRDLDGRLRHPFAPVGEASVLIFVTSDCPIANAYAPEIQDVCRASAPKGVDCLLVYEDPGITPAAARAHLAAYRYSGMPAAIDRDGSIARAATASVTPEAVLIDPTGATRYLGRIDNLYVDLGRRRPAATVHDLREAIEALLAGQPIARPRTDAYGCYITPSRGRSQESSLIRGPSPLGLPDSVVRSPLRRSLRSAGSLAMLARGVGNSLASHETGCR